MMQKVNVGHKTAMDKMVRRRELACICRSRTWYRERFVRNVVSMSLERKKSDQEAKKNQGIGLTQNRIFVAKISAI
jgi:hypothetical protein